MSSSVMYENREEVIPRRATGYIREGSGDVRIVHNYNFDVAGDGQLYSTMEDLLLWDNYLHGAEKPIIHSLMLTERFLDGGEPIEDAQGIRRVDYRGLQTVGHGGSSWGFRTELVRFIEAGLSIAISCNSGGISAYSLARQVADHYLAEELLPRPDEAAQGDDEQVEGKPESLPSLSPEQLAEYAGAYFSAELDASYRFAMQEGELVLRIEQQPRVEVVPIAEDQFEFDFHPAGWWGPDLVHLEFDRNRAGEITGFGLTSGTVHSIVFELEGNR